MLKRVLLAFVFLASVPANAGGADEYANIRTIGVISAIGDSLTLKNVGAMVFSNSSDSLPIQDWGIDAQLTKWISQSLSQRFSLRALPNDAPAFANCGNIRECFTAFPRTDGVDAYLIAYKVDGRDPLGTNQTLNGLGIYRHNVLITEFTASYAMYALAIFDAKTGKMIDFGTARLPVPSILGHAEPWATLEKEDWADSPSALSAQQKEHIRTYLTRMVEISLPMALNGLGLGPEPQATADDVSAMLRGTQPITYFPGSDAVTPSPALRPSSENSDPQPCTNCTPYQ